MISRCDWWTSIRMLGSFLLVSSLLAAQSDPSEKRDQEFIEHTKKLLASTLDSRLPKITLQYFLQYESEGKSIAWEVNDCGEQTGNPQVDEGRDIPTCVEADFDANHYKVTLMIAVGSVKTGMSGPPTLFYGVATDVNGKSYSVHRLGDLPAVVHRPVPRQLRDPQAPKDAQLRMKGSPTDNALFAPLGVEGSFHDFSAFEMKLVTTASAGTFFISVECDPSRLGPLAIPFLGAA